MRSFFLETEQKKPASSNANNSFLFLTTVALSFLNMPGSAFSIAANVSMINFHTPDP